MIATARELFTPPGRRRWFGRGSRAPSCGVVELYVWGGGPFVWDVVVWSSGERAGVELFRVSPAIAENQAEPVPTPAPNATAAPAGE